MKMRVTTKGGLINWGERMGPTHANKPSTTIITHFLFLNSTHTFHALSFSVCLHHSSFVFVFLFPLAPFFLSFIDCLMIWAPPPPPHYCSYVDTKKLRFTKWKRHGCPLHDASSMLPRPNDKWEKWKNIFWRC